MIEKKQRQKQHRHLVFIKHLQKKKEPVAIPDRSYPKGKGASYQEDKDWRI